jgi:H+-translocating NAD(P) transhydrogenase subunit alpha
MKIAVLKERAPLERRVAAIPETVKKLRALGVEVAVEVGAGSAANISDQDFEAAGASVGLLETIVAQADIILSV